MARESVSSRRTLDMTASSAQRRGDGRRGPTGGRALWLNARSANPRQRKLIGGSSTGSASIADGTARFRVTGTVNKLMESNEWTRRAWENALMVAKRAAKLGDLPLIKSDYL